MAWQQTLTSAWLRRGWIAQVLRPLALLYGWLWRLRWQRLSPTIRHQVPVIVVGNVIVGGAGKTPITRALAEWFKEQGWSPAIVSKGYRRKTSLGAEPFEVKPNASPTASGDEPLLLAQTQASPVWVGDDRNACISALLRAHPQTSVVICDDGLQDLSLHRDLEWVVFDERGVGNGWLLPAGPLREPWPRPSGRPQHNLCWVLFSDNSLPSSDPLRLDAPGPMWQIHRHLSGTLRRLDQLATAPLSQWQGAPVQVVTAIAKPHVFIDMLQAQGIQVVHTVIRGDHDALEGIEYALKPEVPVLVTAKDAVKLRRLSPEWQTRCWIADLELIFPDSLSSALSHWAHDNLPELSSTHG